MIEVDGLRKVYRVHEKEAGLRGSIRAFVARTYRDVAAVDGVSFRVAPGEVVGFLGTNGRARRPRSRSSQCAAPVCSTFAAGRFPISAYPRWVRAFLTFVVPIAFLTTVPAEAASGRLTWAAALGAVTVALLLLAASQAFWRYALANYTSASS